MKKAWKKTLALMLALVFCVGLLPLAALAADSGPLPLEEGPNPVDVSGEETVFTFTPTKTG